MRNHYVDLCELKNIFLRLLNRGDSIEQQAKRLVPVAKLLSITSFSTLSEKYAFLNKCNMEHWDFFCTIAAVHVAVVKLAHTVPKDRFESLYALILPELNQLNSKAEDAVFDCGDFVERTVGAKPQDQAGSDNWIRIDALGFWVLWNLLQRPPSGEELQAVRAIGGILAMPFADWWQTK